MAFYETVFSIYAYWCGLVKMLQALVCVGAYAVGAGTVGADAVGADTVGADSVA